MSCNSVLWIAPILSLVRKSSLEALYRHGYQHRAFELVLEGAEWAEDWMVVFGVYQLVDRSLEIGEKDLDLRTPVGLCLCFYQVFQTPF